jgi:hypothetical protein
MSSSEATTETSASLQNIPATYVRIKRQYQQLLDRVTPHTFYRWVGTAVTIALFELRILYAQGVRVLSNALVLPTHTFASLTCKVVYRYVHSRPLLDIIVNV